MRERLVIDTNIVVNAIRKGSRLNAKTTQLFWHIIQGKYDVYVSQDIIKEYRNVLYKYKRTKPNKILRWIWFTWLEKNAFFIEPSPSDQEHVEMKDEDDRIFFDTAKCVNAKLVTRNYRDYPVHELVTLIDELYP